MPPQTDGDYKKLLTEVIKKQILILGPFITLVKARNVAGLSVSDDGTVTNFTGNPQELTQKLIDQFMELSGMIVKKTMEPLLSNYPVLGSQVVAKAVMAQSPIPAQQPIQQPQRPIQQPVQTTAPTPAPQPANQPATQQPQTLNQNNTTMKVIPNS